MLAFLALLPRALVTFLYALSVFLRFLAPSLPADSGFLLEPGLPSREKLSDATIKLASLDWADGL